MTQHEITSQRFHRKTGEPHGEPNTEKIETEGNLMFYHEKSLIGIKEAYEHYWNHLRISTKYMVFVLSIKKG